MPVLDRPVKDGSGALAGAAIGTSAIESFAGIMKELLRASMSNGLVGATVCIMAAALAKKAGVINDNETKIIYGIVLAASGANIAGNLISDLESILSKAQFNNTSIATPAGQVLVFGEAGSQQLNALLEKLKSK